MCFSLIMVNSRPCHMISRNYIKKLELEINKKCNLEAYKKTNNLDVYNCIIDIKNNTCHNLNKYNDYIVIKNDCIRDYNSEYGLCIIIGIMLWVIFGICSNSNEKHRY